MRKKYAFAGQVLLLLAVAGTLFYYKGPRFSELPRPVHDRPGQPPDTLADPSGILPAENITRYVDAIFDRDNTDFPRLDCPAIPSPSRYDLFRAETEKTQTTGRSTAKITYFFAIDLRQNLPLLPRLLGSVVEAIKFLGPGNCALSIVEGNSADGTGEVLAALRPGLAALSATYFLHYSFINPQDGDRIAQLAELRNLALQPLRDDPARYADDASVIFLNDVAACAEDILELIHQRRVQRADMTCGLDWVYVGQDPTFYDVWIARGMNGDSFFEIPPDGNWNSAWNLFWNDDAAQGHLFAHVPFQVFACWNGAAVFTAKPILKNEIRFRAPYDGECGQGEPQLFCKDLWFYGYRKIAVVPSVNLEYADERARDIKALKGYTSQWAHADSPADVRIDWQPEPPALVKCMPSYDRQTFRPWNETL